MNIVVKTTLQFKAKKIYFFGYYYEENSPEEIKNLVVEMDERLNDTWKKTEQDLLLQKKFWSIFQKNFEKLAVNDPIVAQMIYVKKLAKYSTKFLRDNQNWIQ